MLFDGSGRSILERLEELKISASLSRTPAENECHVVDKTRLGQLLERILVIVDVYHHQHNSQIVLPLQLLDTSVDILGM